jgi:hypothetical protein
VSPNVEARTVDEEDTRGSDDATGAFPYTPRDYRRIAILLAVGIHAYLYAGMVVLTFVLHGQDWILGWRPIVVTILSALLFGRFAFRWMMRLDAQYGRGSGWSLARRTVKLPEVAERREGPGTSP